MHTPSFAVMAPLFVGVKKPDGSLQQTEDEWGKFKAQLAEIKRTADEKRINIAISTDVWWGLVEREKGHFDWSYYERLVGCIREVGLRWVPILSTHQCGGNVGDDFDIPIPFWVWDLGDGRDLHYVDEGRDTRHESKRDRRSFDCVSVWATEIPAVQEAHNNFRRTFLEKFRGHIDIIDEVNISLGPSGEARYPSYVDTKGTGYPTRGQLQCYSDLALASFRQFLRKKYGTIEVLNVKWSSRMTCFSNIFPVRDGDDFFNKKKHFLTPFGRDFFDWYHGSLREHTKRQLLAMKQLMCKKVPEFSAIPIGAKIPGIHWRMASDRLAELCTGLIKTSNHEGWESDDCDHGYASLMDTFTECFSAGLGRLKFILHFTCLEMENKPKDTESRSRAKDLVHWIGNAAKKRGITIKGENALSLHDESEWNRISSVFKKEDSPYSGFTCLRLGDLFRPRALIHFKNLIEKCLAPKESVTPSLSAGMSAALHSRSFASPFIFRTPLMSAALRLRSLASPSIWSAPSLPDSKEGITAASKIPGPTPFRKR